MRQTIRDYKLGRVQQGLGHDQQLPTHRQRSDVVKFLEKVEIVPGGCWGWKGRVSDNGYTYYRSREHGVYHGHRMSYLLFVGPLDPDKEIDHLCRNKGCVNPDHLEQVTASTNLRRAKPWTACDRLHPDAATRLGKRKDGRDYCQECQRTRERERRARFAEEQERSTRR